MNFFFVKIFNEELERLSQFDHLTDFCQTFKIQRGKQPIEEEYKSAGEIKVELKIIDQTFNNHICFLILNSLRLISKCIQCLKIPSISRRI